MEIDRILFNLILCAIRILFELFTIIRLFLVESCLIDNNTNVDDFDCSMNSHGRDPRTNSNNFDRVMNVYNPDHSMKLDDFDHMVRVYNLDHRMNLHD